MELEELKASWQSIGESEKSYSEGEIKTFIHQSSHSPLAKIRKNMMGELFAILAVLVGFYVYVFLKHDASNVLFIGLGVLTAISLLVLALIFPRLYKHTKQIDNSHAISYSLEKNVTQLKNDLNLYEKTMLFLYLPACFAGFALSNFVHIAVVLMLILFFPVYYILVKRWTKFFYGKYVTELEEMVGELSE